MAKANYAVEVHGVTRDPILARRIHLRMREVLDRIGLVPVSAQVTFVDDNGPRGGPALRCALTVRVPYRAAVRVEHVGANRRLAFDAAFDALGRRLERYRERDRDARRHPKKYYAARRVVEEPAAAPRTRGTRAR
jgi:ribosome-associated translation inhibitor RaiA